MVDVIIPLQVGKGEHKTRTAASKVTVWQIREAWKKRKARSLNSKSKLKMPTRNRTEER